MFNLLMRSADWNNNKAEMPLERMFEYTEKHLAAYFLTDGKPNFDWLIQHPCLFMDEGIRDEVAYVGRVTRHRISGKEVAIEYQIDKEVPVLRNDFIYEHRRHFDMTADWEFSRNHWAVKEVDLYQVLFHIMRSPVRQRPEVFKIEERETVDPNLVSAMMPFAPAFNGVYAAIEAAAAQLGMTCHRADNVWEHHAIIQDIVQLIDFARIVVVDCTSRNPNVFYEAGIAHTLGREVILITQSKDDIPFDLQHIRHIPYLNNGEGLADLKDKLLSRMKTVTDR